VCPIPLPDKLQAELQSALRTIRDHPQHHFLPYLRIRLYRSLPEAAEEVNSPPILAARVRSWLSILAAQRVLPIFEGSDFDLANVPEEEREEEMTWPRRMTQMAVDVMHGNMDLFEAKGDYIEAHQRFGVQLGWAEHALKGAPMNGVLAGTAAGVALGEVLGYRLVEQEGLLSDMWVKPPSEWKSASSGYVTEIANAQPGTDEDFMRIGDAASQAAVAYSCGETSVRCEPERLEEFWTWWLTEAWQQAWKLGSGDQAE
jgi:hypothetical protein